MFVEFVGVGGGEVGRDLAAGNSTDWRAGLIKFGRQLKWEALGFSDMIDGSEREETGMSMHVWSYG